MQQRGEMKKANKAKAMLRRIAATTLTAACAIGEAPCSWSYTFNEIVPDVRLATTLSACPVRAHQLSTGGNIALRWSTALGTNPLTILTQDQSAGGRLAEIEQVITQSIAAWTGVNGTTLTSASLRPLSRTATQNACGSDGINSICFGQADMAFTPGVLAFTRVLTSDAIGEQIASGAGATQLGQILDADIYFSPADAQVTFATPAVLPNSLKAYDLQSVLTHELGHFFGFSHSAIWSAMMYPYAPAPGTFNGSRPTAQQPDLPLGDDDRTGLRVLYPDPLDNVHVGAITGRVLPANPLALPTVPSGVTGMFGAHVVAVDSASGAVMAGAISGCRCSGAGPAPFDGSYALERLAVGHTYIVYAEPLDGVVVPAQIAPAISTLCRNPSTDAGWPALQGCVVPGVNTSFTARVRPGA